MTFEQILPLILALGGGTGIGLGIKALIETVLAVRAGVSAKEGKRRVDIVQQRDEAIASAVEANLRSSRYAAERDAADAAAQVAKANESRAREYAVDLRLYVMDKFGIRRDDLPEWPAMEETIPRGKLTELLESEKPSTEGP